MLPSPFSDELSPKEIHVLFPGMLGTRAVSRDVYNECAIALQGDVYV